MFLKKLLAPKVAYAHCDIPCGIYDPYAMQVAAHTVIRMTNLLENVKQEDDKTSDFQIARYTRVKDDHAEIVKHEVRVIWGDYFKPEMLQKYPQVNDLVFKILKTASKAKQEISLDVAKELLGQTQEFAEIFYQSKDREFHRVKAPYPTEEDLVVLK